MHLLLRCLDTVPCLQVRSLYIDLYFFWRITSMVCLSGAEVMQVRPGPGPHTHTAALAPIQLQMECAVFHHRSEPSWCRTFLEKSIFIQSVQKPHAFDSLWTFVETCPMCDISGAGFTLVFMWLVLTILTLFFVFLVAEVGIEPSSFRILGEHNNYYTTGVTQKTLLLPACR